MKEPKLIRVGWLIDGSGGPVQKNRVLKIVNGRIDSIKQLNQESVDCSDSIDLTEYTILPCLVDSHVHLFMSGTQDLQIRKKQLRATFDQAKDVISRHLHNYISYGVLAVRDGGDNSAHALHYKEQYYDIKNDPMSLRVAGRAWRNKGRYGRLIGRIPKDGDSLAEAIIKDMAHTDHVKIVNSGLNSLKEFARETQPQFSLEELSEAVLKANVYNLKTMVHANGEKPVRTAIKSGCHSIEHGFFMGKENLTLMAEKQITWVPTAFTMKAYSKYLKTSSLEARISKMNFDHQLRQISMAKELGVSISLGTDAGSLGVHHGSTVIEELRILVEAGYAIQEAVKCASYNGAKLLGIKDLGFLANKMPANFIAVKGSPSTLPQSLESCRVYYQAKLLSTKNGKNSG